MEVVGEVHDLSIMCDPRIHQFCQLLVIIDQFRGYCEGVVFPLPEAENGNGKRLKARIIKGHWPLP